MSRFARSRRVLFLEEPIFEDTTPHLRRNVCPQSGVIVATPVLPSGLTQAQISQQQKTLLSALLQREAMEKYVAWYYTPMALEFTGDLRPLLTIYDCMDELSAFAGAPPAMRINEAALFAKADLVFTGGASLYESKRQQHHSVYAFPSSVDVAHFAQARFKAVEPEDQRTIPHPRLGYAGVIDERMDLALLRELSAARPEWHFVMLGPVAKIQPDALPRAANLHYLGLKSYADLPAYFAGWEIGILPFAMNESTRFISPTKTPEYLAAGLQVISTPIRDVVTPYGDSGLVKIAPDARTFLKCADELLESPYSREFYLLVDQFLSQCSWDKTWNEMNQLAETKLAFQSLSPAIRPSFSINSELATKGLSNV